MNEEQLRKFSTPTPQRPEYDLSVVVSRFGRSIKGRKDSRGLIGIFKPKNGNLPFDVCLKAPSIYRKHVSTVLLSLH